MPTFRLKEIVCEALPFSMETPAQDLYDFGVRVVDPSADGSGVNISAGAFDKHCTVPMIAVKYVSPPAIAALGWFELLTPEEFASLYEEIV